MVKRQPEVDHALAREEVSAGAEGVDVRGLNAVPNDAHQLVVLDHVVHGAPDLVVLVPVEERPEEELGSG